MTLTEELTAFFRDSSIVHVTEFHEILARHPGLTLTGSRFFGTAGPLSDYDYFGSFGDVDALARVIVEECPGANLQHTKHYTVGCNNYGSVRAVYRSEMLRCDIQEVNVPLVKKIAQEVLLGLGILKPTSMNWDSAIRLACASDKLDNFTRLQVREPMPLPAWPSSCAAC